MTAHPPANGMPVRDTRVGMPTVNMSSLGRRHTSTLRRLAAYRRRRRRSGRSRG